MTAGPPRIFDRHALALHRERARRVVGGAFLAREAAEALASRLAVVKRRFQDAVCLDGPGPAFDILRPASENWTVATIGQHETVALESERHDLVVSVLSLHEVDDLPGVLRQIRGKLKPDGLFLAALLGGETLFELRASLAAAEIETTGGVSPRVAPFADVRELGGLLQRAGFALPVGDVERTRVLYRDFSGLVDDLRAHGWTNALAERRRGPLSRAMLAATLAHYASYHAEPDGRLRATFDVVYLTGWAPHESQQKPLAPGSAKLRLAQALGTAELPAGDSADPARYHE